MSAHRYWRILIWTSPYNPNQYTSIAECLMMETIGGSNVATGGTAAASSYYMSSATYQPSNAFDGNAATYWHSGTGTVTPSAPEWLSYDLGSGVTKDIRAISLQARNDFNYQIPSTGAVQYSDDNTNWTTYWVWSLNINSANSANSQIWKFNDPALSAPTRWNIGDVSTQMALDDAERRCRVVVAGTYGTRSTRYLSSDLTYAEFVAEPSITGSIRIGLANMTVALTTLLGNDTGSAAIGYDSGGTVRLNNATVATIMTYTSSDRIGVAVDRVNKKIWFRKNNGNWNNDVIANQNPVGNVGGIDISAILGGLKWCAVGSNFFGWKANFASADWVDTAPTGYVSTDTIGASGENSMVADHAATFTQYGGGNRQTPTSPRQVSVYPANRALAFRDGWYFNNKVWSPAANATYVSGNVQQNGVNAPNKLVCAYEAATGNLIGKAYSDASGNYSIPVLGRTNVYVVAQDPAYQAMVYDQVTPV